MPTPDRGHFDPATRQDVSALQKALCAAYPDADCELRYTTPLELLVATILSAQSTDRRVNQVTETLFREYRTAADFANADPERFREQIRSTGFYNQKAKNVQAAALQIVDRHGGEVPDTMDELVALKGVARKTANVVLGTAFGKAEGFVVDTHVKRLAHRLGLSAESDPIKIEHDLMGHFPRTKWVFLGHAIIWHGRRACHARKPQCDQCPLAPHCPRNGVPEAA